MAQRTFIDGAGGDIFQGRGLVNGAGCDIFRGRTLINGAGCDILLGTPIGDMPVGSTVYIPVEGVPTEFIIVNQGIPSGSEQYDGSCNGTWLLMKDIYEDMYWDSENNDYENSDIHAHLNGTFLRRFEPEIQNIISQVKIPYYKGTGADNDLSTGASGLSTKLFLLSCLETGHPIRGTASEYKDGAKLSYFVQWDDEGGNRDAWLERLAADYRHGYVSENKIGIYWLRTPYLLEGHDTPNTTDGVWNHASYGGSFARTCYSGSAQHGYQDPVGVRPAMIVPFDTLVEIETYSIMT